MATRHSEILIKIGTALNTLRQFPVAVYGSIDSYQIDELPVILYSDTEFTTERETLDGLNKYSFTLKITWLGSGSYSRAESIEAVATIEAAFADPQTLFGDSVTIFTPMGCEEPEIDPGGTITAAVIIKYKIMYYAYTR